MDSSYLPVGSPTGLGFMNPNPRKPEEELPYDAAAMEEWARKNGRIKDRTTNGIITYEIRPGEYATRNKEDGVEPWAQEYNDMRSFLPNDKMPDVAPKKFMETKGKTYKPKLTVKDFTAMRPAYDEYIKKGIADADSARLLDEKNKFAESEAARAQKTADADSARKLNELRETAVINAGTPAGKNMAVEAAARAEEITRRNAAAAQEAEIAAANQKRVAGVQAYQPKSQAGKLAYKNALETGGNISAANKAAREADQDVLSQNAAVGEQSFLDIAGDFNTRDASINPFASDPTEEGSGNDAEVVLKQADDLVKQYLQMGMDPITAKAKVRTKLVAAMPHLNDINAGPSRALLKRFDSTQYNVVQNQTASFAPAAPAAPVKQNPALLF